MHSASVFMDKAATLKKAIKIIEDAGKQDVELLVFPETYVPGYPVSASCRLATLSTGKNVLLTHYHSISSNAIHLSSKSQPLHSMQKNRLPYNRLICMRFNLLADRTK